MFAFILGLVFCGLVLVLFRSARLRTMMIARKRWIRLAGFAFVVAPLPLALLLPAANDDAGIDALTVTVVLGIAMIVLPGAAERAPAYEVAAKLAAERPTSDFSAWTHAKAAVIAPFRSFWPFLRIAGPWIAAPAALVASAIWLVRGSGEATRQEATLAILALFGAVVLSYVGVTTVAIGWHRFALRRELPRWIALPGRSTLPFLWRLWIALLILGGFGQGAEWLAGKANAFGLTATWLGQLAGWSATLFGLMVLAVIWGLSFPAIAEGKKVPLGGVHVVGTNARRVGLGFVLTAFPFLVVGSVASHLLDGEGVTSLTAMVLIEVFLVFAGTAACAHFLAYAYDAYKDRVALTLAS